MLEAPQTTGRIRDAKPSEAENKRVSKVLSEWEAHKWSPQVKEAPKKGSPP